MSVGGRRTNLALLVLLIAALASGVLAYAIGAPWVRGVLIAHAVAGFGILALAPWKAAIARRGLRRDRRGRPASVVLALLVVISIASGVVHAAGLVRAVGPVSPLGIHVAASLAASVLVIIHVVYRPVRPRTTDLSRRTLFRAGALGVGAAALYVGGEALSRAARLPGARRRYTGSHEVGSLDPESMPVTQWLNDAVPFIDRNEWRLEVRVDGATRDRLAYDEIASFDDRLRATIDCTGGWYATQEWSGLRLDRLAPEPGSHASVLVRSATGYARRFPAADAPRLLLAARVGGLPLSAGHGFPLRLVVPGRRGFWWVKWVTGIEFGPTPWWWQSPFPLT